MMICPLARIAPPMPSETGDEDGIANTIEPPGPEFGEEAGVGGVGQLDLKLHLLFDHTFYVVVAPLEIGGEQETLGLGVDAAWHTDADAFERAIAVGGAHGLHALHDLVDGARRLGDKRDGFAGEEAAVEIDEGDDGLVRADVSDEDHHGVVE